MGSAKFYCYRASRLRIPYVCAANAAAALSEARGAPRRAAAAVPGGDRAFGDFEFWGLRVAGGAAKWTSVATCQGSVYTPAA